MKALQYAFGITLVIAAIVFGAGYFAINIHKAFGSVIYGSDYEITEITTGTSSIYTLPGTLGSIIIADSSGAAGSLFVYATSSHNNATSSNDLFLTFDLEAAEGTYVLDVAVPNGILLDVDASNDGDIQITHRR